MSDQSDRNGSSSPSGWTPPKERPVWPWVLLTVVVIGIVINVALTV
ncbi:hypothetical protein [Solihabitans fulvus]|nr:hypothetical protein [Solihabitans fulvus]